MEKAKLKNKRLEKDMFDVARDNPRVGGGKILRVVITSADWQVETHEVTGVIVGRSMTANLAMQGESTDICYMESVRFQQPYDGKRYGKLTIPQALVGARKEILCKNVHR